MVLSRRGGGLVVRGGSTHQSSGIFCDEQEEPEFEEVFRGADQFRMRSTWGGNHAPDKVKRKKVSHHCEDRRQGANDRTLMALGGWKAPAMLTRYAHVSPAHLWNAVEGLTQLATVTETVTKSVVAEGSTYK